ncbi:MAG: oligosaccharide flippase family protein [Rubrivivax sp.]|nr:oligosaccharide flippase family protein [Rubrivivax sp.]
MELIRKLGSGSAIYAGTNLLQKGTALLLLPLYTTFLEPSAYGVLAIVTATNGLLTIVFTLGLTGAVTRFYMEYRGDAERLARFWGSILTFVLLLSALLAAALLVVGDVVLKPLIGDVPFWPYVALGVMATFFQPFFTTFLVVLQTRNEAARYARISLAHFALTTGLTVALIVFLGWGVTGALAATLSGAVVFFALSFWLLRGELRFGLRRADLRIAFGYSLPQVPHAVASQASAITDRIVINGHIGTAAAGVYALGAMVALGVDIVAQSMNRAYVPLGMAALKGGSPDDLEQLRAVGAVVVASFCLLGAAVGAFAADLVWLLATPRYADAAQVVPLLAFAGVASAVYYLLVNVMYFDFRANRLLPLAAFAGAGLNVGLALAIVPWLGLMGAALSALLAQCLSTLLIAAMAYRFEKVRWQYGRYAVAFVLALATALLLSRLPAGSGVVAGTIGMGAKAIGVALLAAALGQLFWGQGTILGRALLLGVRRRPAEAAALFVAPRRIGA